MHIVLCCLSRKPVPPPDYGGVQRFVFWLGKALITLGHQVTLIAHPKSHIPGAELRPLTDFGAQSTSWEKLIPQSADVLHLNSTPVKPLAKPFVITIGGNGEPGEVFHSNSIFVSQSHARNHGSVHFVHNGIDPEEYRCESVRENYAVFLAKASWAVKNLRGAINICRQAGLPLHVIGSKQLPLGINRMLPAIRGVKYHGMLGQAEKVPLLARARCLVFPVRWHEPFGIAVTEALASGCYVLGTPYGSLPEIVTSQTGVLSASESELSRAAKNPSVFDPARCRSHVFNGFTHLDMAKKYLAYYEKVIQTGKFGLEKEPIPATRPAFLANQLLPIKP
jgi:glycosyltransferase involved in cell wall biosynthesis